MNGQNRLKRLQIPLLFLVIAAGAACIFAVLRGVDREIVFRAYLFAYLFALGLALGGLTLLMLHNLTGGDWGERIRPIARAAARTMPLLAILFIPLCFGLPWLYPWANRQGQEEIWLHRGTYLNPRAFFLRAAIYFAIWIVLAVLVTGARAPRRGLSAAGLILYLFTMTHAGIDWIMSRDAEFYSTAFGFIVTVGQTLSALALAVILVPLLPPWPAAPHPQGDIRRPLLNDLGNLLLTLVILWAYVSFMQLLVIWMGNTHEDNTWYLARGLGGGGDATAWRIVAAVIVLFHFFVPFYILLFRRVKQWSPALTGTAAILLFAHALEQYWLVAPSGHGPMPRFNFHWLDVAMFVGVTGLWLCVCLLLLKPEEKAPAGVPGVERGMVEHG